LFREGLPSGHPKEKIVDKDKAGVFKSGDVQFKAGRPAAGPASPEGRPPTADGGGYVRQAL